MPRMRFVLALTGLILGYGMAVAGLTLKTSVGFGGYYRSSTLVPVAVQVQNDGDNLAGEFRILEEERGYGTPPDTYRFPTIIPRGAHQLLHFAFMPSDFSRIVTVEFWNRGRRLATATSSPCTQLFDNEILVAVVGGSGSTFSALNGQNLRQNVSIGASRWYRGGGYSSYGGSMPMPGSGNKGLLRVAYVTADLLPDNPEAYGSVAVLVLMPEVTASMLQSPVQKAIPVWVANGGHLLLSGGGVETRFDDPFFKKFPAPAAGAQVDVYRKRRGGVAYTVPMAAGWVSRLDFNPDEVASGDMRSDAVFYEGLFMHLPRTSSLLDSSSLQGAIKNQNIKQPDLRLIILYLLLYLVLLVPVNYFTLKKLDKREWAWITTPAIVLIFTVGAYGIGYLTKGNRLVLNQACVVETCSGQTSAEAVGALNIFSPSRTAYTVDLGENGLLACEILDSSNPQSRLPLDFTTQDNRLQVRRITVNMWAARSFYLAHQVDLGQGFTARLAPGAGSHASGTITNGTPYQFQYCQLYYDSSLAGTFELPAKRTVDVAKVNNSSMPAPYQENQQAMFASLSTGINAQFTHNGALRRGFVLVGYSTDPSLQPAVTSNNAHATTAMTVMVVHLP